MGLNAKGLIIRDWLIIKTWSGCKPLGTLGKVWDGEAWGTGEFGGDGKQGGGGVAEGEEGVVIKVKRLGTAWEAWRF